VSYLGVSKLSVWQTNIFAAGRELSMGVLFDQRIEKWFISFINGTNFWIFGNAEAV
jgi:hypothetical protein